MSKVEAKDTSNLITEILAAIGTAGTIGIELYLKLEAVFTLGSDEQANITKAIKAGLDADSTTVALIEEWKQQVGL